MSNAPSARDWNALVRDARAARLYQGLGTIVTRKPNGTIVSADPNYQWQHPWWLTALWEEQTVVPRSGKKKDAEWHIYVRPGFVNGIPAAVDMTQADGSVVETYITDEDTPYLVVKSWRNVLQSAGMTASTSGDLIRLPGEGYPKYFEELGARPADLGSHGDAKKPFAATDDTWRKKEIRACDIALVTGRVASSQQITLLSAVIDAQDFQISSTFNNAYAASHKRQFRLVNMPKWTPPREPTAEERFEGSAVEPNTDEVLIATLYMVSPDDPEGGEDAVPDGSWTPYAKYSKYGFWNLNHAAANPEINWTQPSTLTLNTGLAGGIADPIFNSMLAANNDAYNQAVSYLNSISFAGMYWTI